MKNIFFIAAVLSILAACQSDKSSEQANAAAGIHTAVVEEVLQTSQYTYLHVKEGDREPWLALPKMQATVGEKYYYRDGLLMTDFNSKELNRTFPEILFLDNISNNPNIAATNATPAAPGSVSNVPGTAMETGTGQNAAAAHVVVAEEVLQTNQYTYIRAKEGTNEVWLAVAKMEAAAGTTYYFTGGLPMNDFVSKELKRTFKEILFVDNISTQPSAAENKAADNTQSSQAVSTGSSIPLEKKEVKLKHAKEDITIASLFENKKSYSGKKIKIKGQVTKFNSGIMKKNWIHIQDGTDFSGKFDLTITTDQEVKTGDNITAEGVISLDKDFGFNYFYEVLMEDAKITK
ncbi:MAG: hypothetical protein NT126_07930 [Bacteroidetes bacterium]|nr:hypothetical protein [Bacteroidota bacterium]